MEVAKKLSSQLSHVGMEKNRLPPLSTIVLARKPLTELSEWREEWPGHDPKDTEGSSWLWYRMSVYSLVLGDCTNNRSAAERKHHNQGNFTKRSLFRTMVSEGSEFIMEKKL